MKQRFNCILPVILIALLAACSSIPAGQPDLAQARSAYASAKAKAWVNEYAPVEMYEAEQALQRAEQAKDLSDLKQLSYVAERKVQIAVAVANRKLSSDTVAEISREKGQMLQDARDAEIEYERKRADRLAAELADVKAKKEAGDAEAELARRRANASEAELAELNARKTDRGMVLALGDAQFEPGAAQLAVGAGRTIDLVTAFLNEHADRSVLIEGHTDIAAAQEDAPDLSQRRADAVRDALLSRQIPASRILATGCGARFPVAGADSEADRQQNRRVEIVILDAGVTPDSMIR